MLCIWTTCKVIRTVLSGLKRKENINQGAYETTPDHSFIPKTQYRLKSAGLAAVPFMKTDDEQTQWKSVFVLLRLWIMRAKCLFSVYVWASIPRAKVADWRVLRWMTCTPRLHYSLNHTSLETRVDLWSQGLGTWAQIKQDNSVDAPLLHSSAPLGTQAEREAVACSRAEPRGTLWLLEHEADSCSAAWTSTAVCYLNLGHILRLQINFKGTNLRCSPTYMFSILKGLMLPCNTYKIKITWCSGMQKDK